MNFFNITHLNPLFASPVYDSGYRGDPEDSITPARALARKAGRLTRESELTNGRQPVEAVCLVTEGKELPNTLSLS